MKVSALALSAPRTPASVADEERVEDVGADEEGICASPAGPSSEGPSCGGSRGRGASLPTSAPISPVPIIRFREGEQILEVEPPGGEGHQPLVAGDHHRRSRPKISDASPPGRAPRRTSSITSRAWRASCPRCRACARRRQRAASRGPQHLGEQRALREGAERLPVPDVGRYIVGRSARRPSAGGRRGAPCIGRRRSAAASCRGSTRRRRTSVRPAGGRSRSPCRGRTGYGQVTMKKLPNIRSLYQSAARSERQSKT